MATNLDSEFAKTKDELETAVSAAQEYLQKLQADDRSRIAKSIVRAFLLLTAVVVAGVILGMAYFSDWNKIAEPAKFLAAILSSVLLPVVTLVIGHYFGNK
jgi:uncharacterized membrane protein